MEFVNNNKTATRGPFLMSYLCSGGAETYNTASFGRIGEFVGKTLVATWLGHKSVTLDVKSPFNDGWKKLVIRSLEKQASQINGKSHVPFSELMATTKLLFDNTFFQFDNEFYAQIFGFTMSSSISGLFADMVMEDWEWECL